MAFAHWLDFRRARAPLPRLNSTVKREWGCPYDHSATVDKKRELIDSTVKCPLSGQERIAFATELTGGS